MTLGTLLLSTVDTQPAGFLAAIVFALLWGGTISAPYQFAPILFLEITQGSNLGSALGLANLAAGAAAAGGPVMTATSYRWADSYGAAVALCALLCAAAIIPALRLKAGERSNAAQQDSSRRFER
jgi:hypothetical protein